MSRDGDAILIAVCEQTRVNRIEFRLMPKAGGGDSQLVWVATGPTRSVESPFRFAFGDPPDGFESETGPLALSSLPDNYVTMNFDVASGGRSQRGVFASWDGAQISDRYWLTASGGRRATPCPE